MSTKPITIFMSAAEHSGDEHAARLILAIRSRLPEARFVGVAGAKMAAVGCEVLTDMTAQASMLGGPFFKLRYYIRTVRMLQRAIREIKPDLHVPVDSPALNWHLAKVSKEVGTPVVYYIAPQVWAWAPWRVKKVARLTDHVACILPFEEPYLRHRGVNATYVGHPLLESLPPRRDPMPDLTEAWADGTWRVALLPGSRPSEIHAHSRALLACAKEIRRRWPAARCTYTARTEETANEIRKRLGPDAAMDGVDIAVGSTREVLADSHFAVAVSGTVTLEVAHFGVPMVVFYRTGAILRMIHRLLGRWAVPTPHFSLVNILAGRRIVPEIMPWNGSIPPVTSMVMEVMNELGLLIENRRDLIKVVDSLSIHPPHNASENTADLIVDVLKQRLNAQNGPGHPL